MTKMVNIAAVKLEVDFMKMVSKATGLSKMEWALFNSRLVSVYGTASIDIQQKLQRIPKLSSTRCSIFQTQLSKNQNQK